MSWFFAYRCATPLKLHTKIWGLIKNSYFFRLLRDQSGYNFDFRIQYKVLPRNAAVVRYGGIKYEQLQPWTNLTNITSYQSNPIDDFTNSTAYSEHYSFDKNQVISVFPKLNKTEILNVNYSSSETNYTEPRYYLGDLIPGTYCSRIFSDCDKKACRLQSPNYPGVYPRNLTCYFAIRQVIIYTSA